MAPEASAATCKILAALLPHDGREHFAMALFRDTELLVSGIIARGTGECVAPRLRTVTSYALEWDADAMVVAHNHPSGALEPSEADNRSTERLSNIAAALDIVLQDHWIVGRGQARSVMSGEVQWI